MSWVGATKAMRTFLRRSASGYQASPPKDLLFSGQFATSRKRHTLWDILHFTCSKYHLSGSPLHGVA
jgi:hypothetical protein